MTIEQAILEKVRLLPPEKQQVVLDLIELLQADEWGQIYKGRFQELQKVVQIGVEAADRGEVVDAETVFRRLQARLQQQRAQAEQ